MQTLKKIEGKDPTPFEDDGIPVRPPQIGKEFEFLHDVNEEGTPQKALVTAPVRDITEKKERTIIKTDDSVYSLEKAPEKEVKRSSPNNKDNT